MDNDFPVRFQHTKVDNLHALPLSSQIFTDIPQYKKARQVDSIVQPNFLVIDQNARRIYETFTCSHSNSADCTAKCSEDTIRAVAFCLMKYPGSIRVKRYVHAPLKTASSIRLLRIPSAESAKTIDVFNKSFAWCSIVQVDLESLDVAFEALSYVWGDIHESKNTSPVFISTPLGGSNVVVTENLFHAVHALQRPDVDRYIWTDQLCINQLDLTERAHVVRLMPQIYSQAAQTIIWLGRMQSKVDTACCLWMYALDGGNSDVGSDFWSDIASSEVDILSFFDNPWFSRL